MPASPSLRGQGLSLKAIARTLGLGRKTVRRWLRAGQAPTWRHAGTSILDPYQADLEERWQSGCHNAAALWRDLKAQGFPGQPGIVRAWATRRWRQDPRWPTWLASRQHPRPPNRLRRAGRFAC
jgi:transposase